MGYERSTRVDVRPVRTRFASGASSSVARGTDRRDEVPGARARAYAPRMRTTAWVLVVARVVAATVACSGSKCGADDGACVPGDADGGDAAVVTGDGSLEAGAPCASSSACAPGLACGYAIADGCGAVGTCVHFTPGLSCILAPVCTCTGVTLNDRGCRLAPGYATQAIAHDGGC